MYRKFGHVYVQRNGEEKWFNLKLYIFQLVYENVKRYDLHLFESKISEGLTPDVKFS